ncbi:MAG: HAD family phosphatase [Gammaproteobacteria bacterium]|nr:HAD family phosphatase [Gammaproteobacteria bacterium]
MSAAISAIVFDMDGVLVDAKEWHYEALNRALKLFGFEISRYDHLVTYDGLPTRTKLEMLSLERGLPLQLHEFINELKQQYTMELVHARCKPLFAHEYALSRLKAEGYLLGLASNSVRDSVETMMRKTGLVDYFDAMLSNQDVTEPKPAPNIYLEAARRLGVAPEACLVVEDNPIGIKAAEAAGAKLMVVETVHDVTYANIERHIRRCGE